MFTKVERSVSPRYNRSSNKFGSRHTPHVACAAACPTWLVMQDHPTWWLQTFVTIRTFPTIHIAVLTCTNHDQPGWWLKSPAWSHTRGAAHPRHATATSHAAATAIGREAGVTAQIGSHRTIATWRGAPLTVSVS